MCSSGGVLCREHWQCAEERTPTPAAPTIQCAQHQAREQDDAMGGFAAGRKCQQDPAWQHDVARLEELVILHVAGICVCVCAWVRACMGAFVHAQNTAHATHCKASACAYHCGRAYLCTCALAWGRHMHAHSNPPSYPPVQRHPHFRVRVNVHVRSWGRACLRACILHARVLRQRPCKCSGAAPSWPCVGAALLVAHSP